MELCIWLLAAAVAAAGRPAGGGAPPPGDLGGVALSIVLDFSGSMGHLTDPATGQPVPNSRISRTLGELEKALRDLPDGTPFSIRGFGMAPRKDEKAQPEPWESVYTAGGTDRAGNRYAPTIDRRLNRVGDVVDWGRAPKNLAALMDHLRKTPLPPTDDGRFTPLARTMLHAIREDFEGAPPGRRKVMLVLTDGMDTSTAKPKNDPKAGPDYDALRAALVDGFRGQNCQIHLVMIAEPGQRGQVDEVRKQFEAAVRKGVSPAGSVRVIDEVGKLAPAVAEALRVGAP